MNPGCLLVLSSMKRILSPARAQMPATASSYRAD